MAFLPDRMLALVSALHNVWARTYLPLQSASVRPNLRFLEPYLTLTQTTIIVGIFLDTQDESFARSELKEIYDMGPLSDITPNRLNRLFHSDHGDRKSIKGFGVRYLTPEYLEYVMARFTAFTMRWPRTALL
jgi:hypothetical protein